MKKVFEVTIDLEKAEALDADHIRDCLFSKLRFAEKWSDGVTVKEIKEPEPSTLHGVLLVTEPCLGAEGPEELLLAPS